MFLNRIGADWEPATENENGPEFIEDSPLCQICKQKMTGSNIFRDISKALRYFFNHKEKVRIFLLSYAVKVLGGCDLWRG